MTLIIPPGFGSAAYTFTSASGTPPFVTTMGVDLSAAGGDFVTAANQLMTIFALYWGPVIDSDLTLDRVTLAVGQDGPGGSVDSDLAPINMARNATGAPFALAAIVRKSTNDLGRRGRGRCFMPGVFNQSDVGQDGSILPTRRDVLQTAADDWFDSFTTSAGSGPWPPVLLHSQAPADPTPITGLAVSDIVGIQRGRIR